MTLANVVSEKKQEEFTQIKEGILRNALGLNWNDLVPSELMSSLDKMFKSLGVYEIGGSSDYGPSDPLKNKYDIWTHKFTELHSKNFRESTHLLVGPRIDYATSRPYDLIVVTNRVRARDSEELEVLRSLVLKLDADKSFKHIYDSERPEEIYRVDRTIRLQEPLDQETITSPDEAIRKALAIPPAYEGYIEYQRQKRARENERIEKIVADILKP